MALYFAENAENNGVGRGHACSKKFRKFLLHHTSRLAAEQFDRLLTLRATNPVPVALDRAALEQRLGMLGQYFSKGRYILA